jgi:hypothetical protein
MATVRSSRALRTPPRITGILLTCVIRSLKGKKKTYFAKLRLGLWPYRG